MSLVPVVGPPVQIAYAVEDVEVAARGWAAEFGAGPFFVRHHIPVVDVVHRGRSAAFDHSSAYGQWGSVMVELVQIHGTGPDVVHDLYPDGGGGLHHHAHFVADLAAAVAALADAGYPVAMSAATAGGVQFRFVDATATAGHFLELYEPTERLLAFYETVAVAARGWDGRDPVRTM